MGKAKQGPGLFQPQYPESAQQCAVSLGLRNGKPAGESQQAEFTAALAHVGPEALGRKPAHGIISALAARQGQQAGLRSNSTVENQQMSFRHMSCSPELEEKPQTGKLDSAWCSSLSPWKKGCDRAPSAFCSCTSDPIKVFSALNLLLDHHSSNTAPTHCTPSPKGRDNVPNHLQHHLHIHWHSLPWHLPPSSALISDFMWQLQIHPANTENP